MIDPAPCPHRNGGQLDPSTCPQCRLNAHRRAAEQRVRMQLGAEMVERAHAEGRPQHLTASSDGRRMIEVRCDANGHPVALIVAFP